MTRRSTALLLACLASTAAPALVHAAAAAEPRYGSWGVATADMDKGVKPGDDFYRYAEGTWLSTAQIAPDKARAGYNYELPDETEIEVRKLIEDAGPNPSIRSSARSPISTPPGWTRRGSSGAASPRRGPISSGSRRSAPAPSSSS